MKARQRPVVQGGFGIGQWENEERTERGWIARGVKAGLSRVDG